MRDVCIDGKTKKKGWTGLLVMLRCFVIFSVVVFPTPSLIAQAGESVDRDARIIFETVLSPYCPGRTISNCPSPQADVLRNEIKDKLASGQAPADIKDELYETFGDELRTVPRARGIGLLAWVVPGIAFLTGGSAIALWMLRTSASRSAVPEARSSVLNPDAQARLEAELNELDSLT